MKSNCSIVIDMEPTVLSSYHPSIIDHRSINGWPAEFEFMFSKQSETPSSSSNITIDPLPEYATCLPVTPSSLDSSSGLNSSCSTLDLNASTNHHTQQQQRHQLSFATLSPTAEQANGLYSLHHIQSQSRAQASTDYSSSSSSPLSLNPIDMREQEKFKLDRKRERNREAASKCRKKKLAKIQELEEKVKQLKGQSSALMASISDYRDKLDSMRQELLDHAKSGCSMSPSIQYLLMHK